MEIGGDLVKDDLSDPKKDILDRGVVGMVVGHSLLKGK